jgi:hypothetical protein
MIELLKTRFESNRIHRGELSWAVVLARLEAHPEALDALRWMEESGGEPDVIGTDGERILFADCAKESPAGRRSLCYDETARKARKKAPPKGSAEEQAARHGISLMTEQQYRFLQTLGEFDLKHQVGSQRRRKSAISAVRCFVKDATARYSCSTTARIPITACAAGAASCRSEPRVRKEGRGLPRQSILDKKVSKVYPLLVQKVERKGRTDLGKK